MTRAGAIVLLAILAVLYYAEVLSYLDFEWMSWQAMFLILAFLLALYAVWAALRSPSLEEIVVRPDEEDGKIRRFSLANLLASRRFTDFLLGVLGVTFAGYAMYAWYMWTYRHEDVLDPWTSIIALGVMMLVLVYHEWRLARRF